MIAIIEDNKLKGFNIPVNVKNDVLYSKLLELLELETEETNDECKEDDNEPGGPVEDLSSEEEDVLEI